MNAARPEYPPSFAADRCLGKRVPESLRSGGWDVRTIAEVFDDDAQSIPDDVWLSWASDHVDAALTKDKSIRRAPWFESAMIPIFCLSRMDITLDVMVARFDAHRDRIWHIAADRPGRQWWTIYDTDMRRII